MDDIMFELQRWKNHAFRDFDLKFSDAVESLHSNNPKIEARPYNANTWSLYSTDKNAVASFYYAAIWSWNSDLNTGNFVPRGEKPPESVPEARIENSVGHRCAITYCIDTSIDDEIYDLQQKLEEHVKRIDAFNPNQKPRKDWQSGSDPSYRRRYQMTVPIFTKRSPMNALQERGVKYRIHEWIKAGLAGNPAWFPNPSRPGTFGIKDRVLKQITECQPNQFARGDIVWFSFSVSFVIGTAAWATEITPIDLIRVGSVPVGMLIKGNSYGAPTVDRGLRPLLQVDEPLKLPAGYEDPDSSVVKEVSNQDGGFVDLHATEDDEMGDGDGSDIVDVLDGGYTLDSTSSGDGLSHSMAPLSVTGEDSLMLDEEWGDDTMSESPLMSSEIEGDVQHPPTKRKRLSVSIADKAMQNIDAGGVSLGRRATRSLHAASRKNV